MLDTVVQNMGLLCSRHKHGNQATTEENDKAAEIERRIEQETKAEKHIQKLLLLEGICDYSADKTTISTGFDERELQSYIPVIHANVYQTIKVLHDGAKELALSEEGSSKYGLTVDNKKIGEKLSEIGGRLDFPLLNEDLVQDILKIWRDPAIQETYARGNELQVPDCADYFLENLHRLSEANYIPTKEDVLHARVRTTGVVEIQFRYDQTLFEDECKNRIMETKELFEWVLKQKCFEVPLSVCEWFRDYQPVSTGKQEVEHAYEFVNKKIEEL
ncbi:hypothetical protein R6Q59_021262 [Mikania micrantha]